MANNRDPRKKARINRNRNRLTSSSNRAARSRASAADTPRPTSSANRSSRTSGRAVVTQSGARGQRRGAQGPRNPPVQGPSRRTPNAVAGDTGRTGGTNKYGTKQPTGPQTPTPRANPRTVGGNLLRRGIQQGVKQGVKAGSGSLLAGAAKPLAGAAALLALTEGLFPRRTGIGTLQNQPVRPNNQKPKPKSTPAPKPKNTQLSAGARSFDKAFAAARKAGKSTFTWRGRSYNTKYKGE